ncbi:MAG: Dihydrofolate synthase/folylpolyglutamate synthase [Candidatus Celerinatantimonas neptuna]|nr:MAG: Dihydrofolate synthase/folylpolyglutamate synthase [Candidatus Celerinatantimonas neptuna]
MSDLSQITSRSLTDWLSYLEKKHPVAIDLGLDRVGQVASRMGLTELSMPVVTVAGTNGKGSTCRLLEQLLLSQGYSVGVYSSPHIVDYRERVRINDKLPDADVFCRAFDEIETVRDDVSLTYFEVGTLAALRLFQQVSPDFVILEVGLGGRLDATNIIDADVAIVTTVALDHVEYLGHDLQAIGREKAGIFRSHGRAVIGDPNIVSSVYAEAEKLNCNLLANGYQVKARIDSNHSSWDYIGQKSSFHHLPIPHLPVDNAVASLAALEHLNIELDEKLVQSVIANWQLSGRMQLLEQRPEVFVDVAHNPQSAEYLATQLRCLPKKDHTFAVCAMLIDKDNQGSVEFLKNYFDQWFIAGLDGPRGDNGDKLANALSDQPYQRYPSVHDAYLAARQLAHESDRIIVFGSFLTVAQVLAL